MLVQCRHARAQLRLAARPKLSWSAGRAVAPVPHAPAAIAGMRGGRSLQSSRTVGHAAPGLRHVCARACSCPQPGLQPHVRWATSAAAADSEEEASDEDTEEYTELSLGDLLRPNPVSTLENFDPTSRCVVVRHDQRALSWQERSSAVQATLEARNEATPDMFMVLVIKGKQYKVTMDDVIAAEKLDVEINDLVQIDSVLLVGSKDWTVVGTPHVPTASVVLQVEEHMRTQKVHVFKKKRRKGYARSQGHRQNITMLRVVAIDFDLDELESNLP
jgi:large subunit ribosomal protein L21|eukprot:COSAG03_NODE_2492_length_2707_cov_2.004985_1_plen_274_part_00